MNLNHLLEQISTDRGSETAIRFSGKEISYTTITEAVRRLARSLYRLGIRRCDRVAIMLPNLPQFPIAYYAVLRLGAVVVPINMMYKGNEAALVLEDSEAKALIAWSGIWNDLSRHVSVISSLKNVILLGDSLPDDAFSLTKLISNNHPMTDIVNVEESDPAVVQYTAGVTGTPKGVELTHGNIASNVNACREIMQVTPQDVLLTVLPLFHPIGQTLLMHLPLCSGATMALHPKFDIETVYNTLMSGDCTIFVGVPSIFNLLIDQINEDNAPPEKPIRLCVCGGGAINDEVLKEFEKAFGTYILEAYTTSETSPVTSFNQWRTGRRVGSLGHPIPGVEMKVVNEKGDEASIGEVGEIIVKGSNVMRGYINRPRMTEEVLRDGWFYTGDFGKMDINGFFYLVGRKNDRIIKGGFSIYPSEVETVLYGHPDVSEVAIVGIPDEIMGEEVKACIVLKEEATISTEQLAEYCRERMALYKVPAVIRFYKDLPTTSTGRIDKDELRG
ncbi:MAG: long-chain fatty acid--CoA ligase [Candidatus Hatepunaea meridiana]|nr:long-chain fatty acid--CoA ligase [Candidatus Hatepunaea meridiana]